MSGMSCDALYFQVKNIKNKNLVYTLINLTCDAVGLIHFGLVTHVLCVLFIVTLKIKTQSSLNRFYYWRLILVTFSFYDFPSMTKNPCDVRSSGSHPELHRITRTW